MSWHGERTPSERGAALGRWVSKGRRGHLGYMWSGRLCVKAEGADRLWGGRMGDLPGVGASEMAWVEV